MYWRLDLIELWNFYTTNFIVKIQDLLEFFFTPKGWDSFYCLWEIQATHQIPKNWNPLLCLKKSQDCIINVPTCLLLSKHFPRWRALIWYTIFVQNLLFSKLRLHRMHFQTPFWRLPTLLFLFLSWVMLINFVKSSRGHVYSTFWNG